MLIIIINTRKITYAIGIWKPLISKYVSLSQRKRETRARDICNKTISFISLAVISFCSSISKF